MNLATVLPVIFLISFSNNASHSRNASHFLSTTDTLITSHRIDGKVNEWPSDKFTIDPETAIQYAMDNDGDNLYIAMNIPAQSAQMRIMRRGMNMFIDLKERKKETRGIEFPLQAEDDILTDEGVPKTDMRKIRMMMALHMIYLKYFGFTKTEATLQDIKVPGSICTAFAWDSADVMHIEYLIPLKMIAAVSSLDKKEIQLGWKFNPFEKPQAEREGDGEGEKQQSTGGHHGRGGGYGGSRSSGTGSYNGTGRGKIAGDQGFWTVYTVRLPAPLRAF